jgi:hypothetical protein
MKQTLDNIFGPLYALGLVAGMLTLACLYALPVVLVLMTLFRS